MTASGSRPPAWTPAQPCTQAASELAPSIHQPPHHVHSDADIRPGLLDRTAGLGSVVTMAEHSPPMPVPEPLAADLQAERRRTSLAHSSAHTLPVKVGLVLGGGGLLGSAWLVGVLDALASETGWDPGSAQYVVGTSAGAMIAGLCACGVPAWFMLAQSAGEMPQRLADEPDGERTGWSGSAVFRLHRGVPPPGPGSWRLALASLARPSRYSPAALLAGLLPQGLVSSEPLKQTIRRVAGDGWAPHPHLWIMACDHHTGQRVALGRSDAPPVSLADAVAASCAVPGFYRPVTIAGRRYVDGGVVSTSNLDLVADLGLDLVICLNPMSSLHAPKPRTPGERAAWVLRQASGRRLGSEAKRVRASGTEVLVIQPTLHDLDAMGTNLMSTSATRRKQVIQTAAQTATGLVREPEVRARLRDLPRGQPPLVRRPPGPLTDRPDFAQLARGRWERSG
ncbi:MAG TPA: patatin-like phospholipase family protein [Solirubrobacteraceae bacterium]|nr:patatin-like phospholipase family protein [Solirubrobacteraceae bacterium]